jgi:hypothetical protein
MAVGGLRYAHIGLAVGLMVLGAGLLLFRNAGDEARQAMALVSFVVTFAVYHGLDERNKRRQDRDQ